MALNVIVKNTFLDVDDCDQTYEAAARKRSSSVPRTWKLRSRSGLDSFDGKRGPPSIISTSASDGELSDAGSGFDPSTPEQQCSPTLSCGDTTFQDRLKMCSPAAGIQKGLYMSLGNISDLVLPPAMQSEQPVSRRSSSGTLNPAAAEFKMPEPSPTGAHAPVPFALVPGFPMLPELTISPMNSATGPMISPAASGFVQASPLPSPGGSRLNPKARAFEPGASVYGSGTTAAKQGGTQATEAASQPTTGGTNTATTTKDDLEFSSATSDGTDNADKNMPTANRWDVVS